MTSDKRNILNKSASKNELCEYFGISHKTLRGWLKPHINTIGEYRGRCYTPRQVRIILELFD